MTTTSTWLSRDDFRDIYLRAIKTRADALGITASTGPGEGAYVDACACADQCLILSNYAKSISGTIALDDLTGDQLDTYGASRGCSRPQATGASGAVTVNTGSTGATIVAGDLLVNNATQIQYKTTSTVAVSDGATVAVVTATETGPDTNVAGNTVLSWVSPRPGLFSSAVVVTQPSGNGLSGGANALDDDDYRALLKRNNAAPVGVYNTSFLLQLIADSDGSFARGDTTGLALDAGSTGHGVGVAQGFVYPAIWGPGTVGITFVLSTTAVSKVPSAAQVDTVLRYVSQYVPSGTSLFAIHPLEQIEPIVSIRVRFSSNGFQDTTPWPPYSGDLNHYYSAYGDDTSSPTQFIIWTNISTSSATFVAPSVGNHIGVFDYSTGKFYKKSISSVTANTSAVGNGITAAWNITCDSTASDTSFIPSGHVSPWSDSLQSIADAVMARAAKLGPGEAISPAPPDGIRAQRVPVSTGTSWPSSLTSTGISDIYKLANVSSAQWVSSDFSPRVVNDGTHVYVLEIADLEVHAL